MTRLLLVSGSLRRDSLNTRLLHELAQRLHGQCETDLLLPAQAMLPLFDQDLEYDPDIGRHARALHQRVCASNAIIIACPEYNGQPTAYLKNLVDWVSRLAYLDPGLERPFSGKPLLLCSASSGGSGGHLAIPVMRALFRYVGSQVLEDAISLPWAEQAWHGDGYRFDPFFDAHLDAVTEQLLQQAHTRRGQPSEQNPA